MRLSNKQSVINAVQTGPGIGVAGLSEVLGIDKGTVRKVALEACREGELTAQNNGQGYVFFPVSNAPALSIADHGSRPAGPVIDGDFKVVSPPPSDSRALVPSTGTAASFDSRLAGTLARNDRARRLRSPQGQAMGQGIIAALNQGYLDDPTGDLTLAPAAQAEIAAEREQLAREQEQAARALAVRSQQPPKPTLAELIGAAFRIGAGVLDAHQSLARRNAEPRAPEPEQNPRCPSARSGDPLAPPSGSRLGTSSPPDEPPVDFFETRRKWEEEIEAEEPAVDEREEHEAEEAASTQSGPPWHLLPCLSYGWRSGRGLDPHPAHGCGYGPRLWPSLCSIAQVLVRGVDLIFTTIAHIVWESKIKLDTGLKPQRMIRFYYK